MIWTFLEDWVIFSQVVANRLNPPVVTETSHVTDSLRRLRGKIQSPSHRFGHSANKTFAQAWEETADSTLCLHPLHCGSDDAGHASNDTWRRQSFF